MKGYFLVKQTVANVRIIFPRRWPRDPGRTEGDTNGKHDNLNIRVSAILHLWGRILPGYKRGWLFASNSTCAAALLPFASDSGNLDLIGWDYQPRETGILRGSCYDFGTETHFCPISWLNECEFLIFNMVVKGRLSFFSFFSFLHSIFLFVLIDYCALWFGNNIIQFVKLYDK